jgi:TolB-like protein/DNA-binding winged helix-turn-helix (wHTH) protein/Flp pilus assembly protein TadD
VVSKPTEMPDPIRFGDNFELDPLAYELRSKGIPLKLKPIPMELLLLLVERRGELVTREQIVERIWGKGVFLDTDNSINASISRIRQVLRDDAEQPRFVQTITGKGYRFIAPVVEGNPAGFDTSTAAAIFPPAPPGKTVSDDRVDDDRVGDRIRINDRINDRVAKKAALRLWPSLLLAFVLLIAGLGVYFRWSRSRSRLQPSSGRVMLAVLPFENLTGDSSQEYFSDGLTEEMIARLGNLDPQHLGVIARTSVMHYKHSPQPLAQIGRDLGIQYVLEGSVRRESNKVRITAQLIQMSDQSHLWARQYDRELSNLLALQEEIAQEVAGEIELALGGQKPVDVAHQPALSPDALEAYDLYLKGRYFWNKRTPPGFQEAIEYFQNAVAKNPNDARAYAGLADSYSLLSGYSTAPQTESMPKARTAALKAVELDEKLSEAHTSLALIAENYDWNWQASEREFRRAIELNPNYATAHQWYAEFLAHRGRFDEAFAESERARQFDPMSLIIATDKGQILYYSRQYDRAIAQLQAVLEMDPNFTHAHIVVEAYIEKGRFADALADLEKTNVTESGPWSWAWLAYAYGRAGQPAKARHALEQLQQLYRRQAIGPDPALLAYIGVGDRDEAFVWFEKAYVDHSNSLTSLKVNPVYDPLRGDPRFQDLLRRVGLAQ